MFSWLGSIFAKVTSATASVLIAVGLISTPSVSMPSRQVAIANFQITEEQKTTAVASESVTSEIEKLKKDIEELKNTRSASKLVAQTQTQIQPQVSPKSKTFTLPSGLIVDENGNILNQTEISQKQLLVELEKQRNLLETERKEAVQKTKAILSDTEIVNRIKPIIVKIGCGSGSGSGLVIDADGYILTAYHVISGCSDVEVVLFDGEKFNGAVTGYNENTDSAILKINANNLVVAELGDSSEAVLPLGSKILVFGHPLGLSGVVMTRGDLLSRQDLLLHTDAKTQGGSSGGAWVNGDGKVVGIHTSGQGPRFQGYKIDIGFNYAIAINNVKGQIPELKSGAVKISTTPSAPPGPPQPDMPQGSTRTIPRSIVGSIGFNPNLTCDQLSVSDKSICWQYQLYRDRYNWTISDGQ